MNFQYKVRVGEGQVVSNYVQASSRDQALKELKRQGLSPLVIISAPASASSSAPSFLTKELKPAKQKFSLNMDLNFGKQVKDQEILMFTRDMVTLVNSGVPLMSGLKDILEQIKNKKFRAILEDVYEEVNAGNRLSDAFEKYPKIFSEFYINSLRAGEQSGRLVQIMTRLIEVMDRDIETTMAVKDAVRYPTIVISFLGAAFVFIITFVVPKIAALFTQFNTALPLPTRIIITLGFIAQKYGLLILGMGIAAAIAFSFYKKTSDGKLIWSTIKLRLPVFGSLFQKLALNRFAATLQTLHASGLVLTKGLNISARVVDNELISRGILKAQESLTEGKSLYESLAQTRLFPPLVLRMVMIGEKTGNLEQMLGEIVHYYDREIKYMTKAMTSLIEPILTVCLGGMILVFALGVFLPMWNVMKLLKGGA